ncbi:MAG: amidohydrolase family protein [Acidobacteria bacterium]|nr:amidohydrolase family protein [Acidobacteriota bacterium]
MSQLRSRSYALLLSLFAFVLTLGPGGATLLGQSLPPELAQYAYADMILYNGKVLTVDDKFTIAQAVAVRDGKILAVGDSALIQKLAGPKTDRIDLRGNTLTPGFIDAHSVGAEGSHAPAGPYWMKNYTSTQCTVLDDCLRKIKAGGDKAPPGEWVFVNLTRTGAAYKLNLQLLDSIAPNNLLVVNLDNTTAFVNSKTLETLKDDMSDEHVLAGLFVDKDGKFNGRVTGSAYGILSYEIIPFPEGKALEEMIQIETIRRKFINRMGVTTMGGRTSGLTVSILREIQRRGEMPMRLRMHTEVPRLNPRTERWLKRLGNLMDVGDEWFKIGGATIDSIDGGGGNFTRKAQREVSDTGFDAFGQNKWAETVRPGMDWKKYGDYQIGLTAAKYGWNVADLHVQGDAGVELTLELFDEANKQSPVKGRRFGIVHGLMRPPDLAKRLAVYDAALSMSSEYLFRGDYVEELVRKYGADDVAGYSPIRSLIDFGAKPVMEVTNTTRWRAGGGMMDRTRIRLDQGAAPYELGRESGKFFDDQNLYLNSMELFVTRKNMESGKVWGPNERVTRAEVLKMATAWAARYSADEKIMGTIEPGKLADFVILGGDYLTVPEDKISDLPILKVILGGKVTYDKDRDEAWYQAESKKTKQYQYRE